MQRINGLVIAISLFCSMAYASAPKQRYPGNCSFLLKKIDVVDPRYGNTYQQGPKIEDENLLNSGGSSMLCGPSCIVNVAQKFRKVLGLRQPFENNQDELVWLVKTFLPLFAFDEQRVVENGVSRDFYLPMIKHYLGYWGIKVRVVYRPTALVRSNAPRFRSFAPEVMRLAVQDESAVIISSSLYSVYTHDDELNRDQAFNSHLNTVAGYKLNSQKGRLDVYLIESSRFWEFGLQNVYSLDLFHRNGRRQPDVRLVPRSPNFHNEHRQRILNSAYIVHLR